ncbi:MAG: hypothetical protein ACREKH_20480 [Candidatus Rokuibacteriota bacterium]
MIHDGDRIVRFEGLLYHPGCLIQHRLELRAQTDGSGSLAAPATAE